MTKNLKILTVALVLLAAVFMKVINYENAQNLQGKFEGPVETLTQDKEKVASNIRDCFATPGRANLQEEGLTTIAFQLIEKANVQVEIRQKEKTLQALPSQGMLAEGINKLVWTNKVIKELVSGRTGDYVIRFISKTEKESTFCEVPFVIENK